MPSKKKEEVLVTSLGELYKGLHEHRYWSSKRGRDRYPFPIGYQATRVHGGHEYRLEISEGPKGPDFVVLDHRGMRYVADSAVRAWSVALKGNGRAGHVKENADGGEIFGFTQPMVRRYLQDMVAKAGGVPDFSSTPLSPLATNVATTSGRDKESLKSEERPSQVASARGKGKQRKREGQTARSPLSRVNTPGVSEFKETPLGSKRQKLGDSNFENRRFREAHEALKQVLKPAVTHGVSEALLEKEDVGAQDEQARGKHVLSQELADGEERNRKRVGKTAKVLLERRAALKEALCANTAALAAARTLKRPHLAPSDLVLGTTVNLSKSGEKPQEKKSKRNVHVREPGATENKVVKTCEEEREGRGPSLTEAEKAANEEGGSEDDAENDVRGKGHDGLRRKGKKGKRAKSAEVGAGATTGKLPADKRKKRSVCAEGKRSRASGQLSEEHVQPGVRPPDEKAVLGLSSEEKVSEASGNSLPSCAEPLEEGQRPKKRCANCPHRSSFEVDLDADTQVDSDGSLAADQLAKQTIKEAEVESPVAIHQEGGPDVSRDAHPEKSDRCERLKVAAESVECPLADSQVVATHSKKSRPVEGNAFANNSEAERGVKKDLPQIRRFEDDSTEAPDSDEEMLVAEGRDVAPRKVGVSRKEEALKLDEPAGWITAVRTATSVDVLKPDASAVSQAQEGQPILGEEKERDQTKLTGEETQEQEKSRVSTGRNLQKRKLDVVEGKSPSNEGQSKEGADGSDAGKQEAGLLKESAHKQRMTSPDISEPPELKDDNLQFKQAERKEGAPTGQEKRKRTSTLSLFKETAQWIGTEEGKRFAEEAKEQLCEEEEVAFGGSKKPKMARLSTLAGIGCERAGDGEATALIPLEQNKNTAAPECDNVAAKSETFQTRGSSAQKQEESQRELRRPLESVERETSKAEEDPKGARSTLRIVGSDSLTEQQSELPFSEIEAAEMQEGAPDDVQTEVLEAAAVAARESDKVRGDVLDRLKKQQVRAFHKDSVDADEDLNRSCTDASEPKISEAGLQKESKRRGSKASVQSVATKSPGGGGQKLAKAADSECGKTSAPNENGTWFSKFVNKLSSPFKAQPMTGFKPLELVRSDQVVSNAPQATWGPVLDTTAKAKPRNKSWPVWSGPTSNANLGGSARKASVQGVKSPLPEAQKESGEALELGRERNRALESQARRLGHFEESEAVKDWPTGDFLVPNTPPDSAGETNPVESRTSENAAPANTLKQLPQQGLEPLSLRPMCCIEQPGGAVLWTVIKSVGQETKLAVCVETGKARRSVFVYSLCREETVCEVEVRGEIAGEVRASDHDEQVSATGPFLDFCPNGKVLVVTSALHLTGFSPEEAASKKPCIRLLTLLDQKPQVLARLDCASPSSCLVTAGSSTLAVGGEQGVVECWTMKADWCSYEEKWVLPVARYRGVTFPAIQQLLHVPGRPHQLLGCAENGSFALWDVQQRTLLSTCHSKHILLTSAHVLCGPSPIHTKGHGKFDGGVNALQPALIHTDENEELVGDVNTLYLLLRATVRGNPGRGASCLAALLKGDQIAVGKELLVAEKAVQMATLGSTAVAADNEGRFLMWDALTGKTTALVNDLKGSSITSISVDATATLLVVGAQDSRVLIYDRLQAL